MTRIASINDSVRGGYITVESVVGDPPSIGTLAEGNVDLTIAGVNTDDIVLAVQAESLVAGVYIRTRKVQAANTVRLVLRNETAGTLDDASQTFVVVIFHIAAN